METTIGSCTSPTVCKLSLLLFGFLSFKNALSLILLGRTPSNVRRSAKLILDGLDTLELVLVLRLRRLPVVSASGGSLQHITAIVCARNFLFVAKNTTGCRATPTHAMPTMFRNLGMLLLETNPKDTFGRVTVNA